MDELYWHKLDVSNNQYNLNWDYGILPWENFILNNSLEIPSWYRLVEYMSRNRNRFLVIMDNNTGDVIYVAKNNWPLTLCNRQKHLIEWVIRRGNFERFSELPNNTNTALLIAKIQDNVTKKLLWNIKHPEISGTFVYKTSKNEALLVQVQNGKVILIEPKEYNFPQQRWAIQKKLNQFWNNAFSHEYEYGKELYELEQLLHKYESELIKTVPQERNQIWQYTMKMSNILWEIFNYLQFNFPNIEFNWDNEGKHIHNSIKSLHRLLHKAQIKYPLLYSRCEFIKSMINNIKDILIKLK